MVSGCYIVKDEEDVLAASLQALGPFVDEIVVYDTGSSDRTREIAREFGAVVVEGLWDDDFGAARNRALEHCRGRWVFAVDADELVRGDAGAFRDALRASTVDWLHVAQVSEVIAGTGRSVECFVPRLLRPATCRWEGAIHEQIVAIGAPVRGAGTTELLLEHSGLDPARRRAQGKDDRNLRVAEQALARARRDGEDTGPHLVEVTRAAWAAGQPSRAAVALAEADPGSLSGHLGLRAAHVAVDVAVAVGEPSLAAPWLGRLREWGETDAVRDGLAARLALSTGDAASAVALLARQARTVRVDSAIAAGLTFADTLIDALTRLARFDEAVDLLVEHVAASTFVVSPVRAVLLAGRAPGGPGRLARAVPEALLVPWIGELAPHGAEVTCAFFEGLWAADRCRPAVLAAAAGQWATLPFDEALTWSLRLREAGLAGHCPLRRVLTGGERDLVTRVLSGAVLVEIGEHAALRHLEPLLAAIDEETAARLLPRLRRVAPRFTAALLPASTERV
nr:glycosyltransferase family 2 protein [Kineococcus aurantiacus]